MPVTLVTTVEAANANAYCSLAEANAYHEGHSHASAWTGTDDQKNRAIVTATRLLEEHYEWYGWVMSGTQALGWPRGGVWYRSGYAVPDDIIPQAVKDATAELARALLVADRTADSDVETQGISSLKAGSVEIAFDTDKARAKVVPDSVRNMLRYFGRLISGPKISAAVVR